MRIKPFSREQLALIENGNKLSSQLASRVEKAFNLRPLKVEVKRHTYIMSPPGAGKTFAVEAIAKKHRITLLKIQGVESMSAFVQKIAVAVHSLDKKDSLVVWIDDCDSLFMDRDSLNIMKGVLDEERNVLSYGKNLTTQIMIYEKSSSQVDQLRAAALRHFQSAGSVGVEIPTSQLRFVITSNKALTPPNSALTSPVKMNEAAIRDRVSYVQFDLTAKESWGWVASVLLNNDLLGLNKSQKQTLLHFMWINLFQLSSTSMRTVKDLAAAMINHPAAYYDFWETELISSRAA